MTVVRPRNVPVARRSETKRPADRRVCLASYGLLPSRSRYWPAALKRPVEETESEYADRTLSAPLPATLQSPVHLKKPFSIFRPFCTSRKVKFFPCDVGPL